MASKILKRLLTFFLTLLFVSLVVFVAVSLAPGDSSAYVLSEEATEAEVEAYRVSHGLSGNILLRYFRFMLSFFRLDWGKTIGGISVREAVFLRLPVTLSVAVFSILLAFVFSLFFSLKAVEREGSAWDTLHLFFTMVFLAFPSFLVSLALVMIFGMGLKLFPVAGYFPPSRGLHLYFRSLFLPSLTLAILHSSLMMRLFREELRHNLSLPFSRTALAKGVKEKRVAWTHALKPSLVLMLSVLSESIASAFLGSAVVESVFALPGLGSLVVNAALSRDVATTSTVVLLVTFLVSFVYLLSDLLGYALDPRKGRGDEAY